MKPTVRGVRFAQAMQVLLCSIQTIQVFYSLERKCAGFAGTKYIKTKLPTTKKKEKWSKDTLIDGRYEPAQIVQVLEVIAGCKNANVDALAEQFYRNTLNLFFTQRNA